MPYFHICLNLTNVYIDIKDKILANIRVIANNLFFVLKLCKQFILAFQALQTIFFKFLIPPSRKIMVRPLYFSPLDNTDNVEATMCDTFFAKYRTLLSCYETIWVMCAKQMIQRSQNTILMLSLFLFKRKTLFKAGKVQNCLIPVSLFQQKYFKTQRKN